MTRVFKSTKAIIADMKVVNAEGGVGGVVSAKDVGKVKARAKKVADEKKAKIAAYRREASRMATMLNKRLDRLEKKDLKDSPAYLNFMSHGGHRFSVKGKTYNQVQSEMARMNRFMNQKTSTIKGIQSYVARTAELIGMKGMPIKEAMAYQSKFFQLTSKVEEYLRVIEDLGAAIGYQQIWEAVNVYIKDNRIDMTDANTKIDSMIAAVSKALAEKVNPTYVENSDVHSYVGNFWFTPDDQ